MPESELDAARAMLAAEIELLKAQRRGCPPDSLAVVDYFILMAEAVKDGGTLGRIRAVLVAIQDSRIAGLLRRLPDTGADPRADTEGRGCGGDDSTRLAVPADP